jgi:hypothetical protein
VGYVDEMLGTRKPKVHHRDEALAASKHFGVLAKLI